MTPTTGVVDVDDPNTWPPAVGEAIERWHLAAPPIDYVQDLPIQPEIDAQVRELLGQHPLRMVHGTRLLEHEAELVRTQGLRPFSEDLFTERLDAALAAGALDAADHAALRDGQIAVSEPCRAAGREDQVCLTVGRSVLDNPWAVERLLGVWGGEGISYSTAGCAREASLTLLGSPTIVVCAVVLGDAPARLMPQLATLLLAARRGQPLHGDVFLPRPVHASEIELLATPGHPVYDEHPDLPRH